MPLNKETISAPPVIFTLYMIAACLVILGFRLIFPGEAAPLPIFSQNWRLIRGLLDILTLFPALALSALVIPFGIASDENYFTGFSQHLLQRLTSPLITAICASGLYAVLFFLVLPLAQNYEENLRFKGDVYQLAKERAYIHKEAEEWLEVSQLLGICDSIWQNSPEIAPLRIEMEIHLQELRFEEDRRIAGTEIARNLNSASITALPGQGQPVNATEAISLGEIALSEARPFDAHWLATLGGRIAKTGSVESIRAAELAAQAWNQIESQQPNSIEARVYSIYQLKLSGYEAMVSGDWIRAYYIFKDLLELTPNDPDAEQFFAASEKGTKESAFFIDEMEVSLGETLANTIFSLPGNQGFEPVRLVMRISSLSSSPDYAYGTGIEYMVFDHNARPLFSIQAPYAKFLPITLNEQHQVLVMMRALDRHDGTRRWEPEWNIQNDTRHYSESAQITLNVNYETFLMLSEMRQGLPSLQIDALFDASRIAGETGYIPQVFEAEILNRLSTCLFFLPVAVITIIMGWHWRARYRSRYLFVLSFPILPIVFNSIVHLYRIILNTMGISLVVAFNFSLALTALIIFLVVTFILSLIALAAQHD